MKNVLSYKTHTKFEELGGAMQSQRFYFDFVIDGKLLSELLGVKDFGMIGAIETSNTSNYGKEKIRELLLEKESELGNDRILIYGCSECLDIGCGAMTVKVEKLDDTIIWKDFAYENGYEKTDFEEYKKIGSFVFEQKAYQDLFTEMKYLY